MYNFLVFQINKKYKLLTFLTINFYFKAVGLDKQWNEIRYLNDNCNMKLLGDDNNNNDGR